MDAETEEKIEKLATTLKEKHLAGSFEEARERARQIILSSQSPAIKESLKSITGNEETQV